MNPAVGRPLAVDFVMHALRHHHNLPYAQASLKRMDLEYVDLLFAHRPDIDTPIEESVRAFNHVIDQVSFTGI